MKTYKLSYAYRDRSIHEKILHETNLRQVLETFFNVCMKTDDLEFSFN